MATKSEQERLAVVETKLDTLIDEVRDMKQAFAAKWVERVVAGLIGAILIAFLGVLLALVFNQPEAATIPLTRTTTITVNTDGTTTKTVQESTGKKEITTSKSEPGAKPSTTVTTEEVPQKTNERQSVSGLLHQLGL